jgi:hypothetical protein
MFNAYGPSPRAPLHEELKFLGRVAEALGCKEPELMWGKRARAGVSFTPQSISFARHLSDAVMLAAIEARRERSK